MRCRKVRSYLSAFCRDELADRDRLAISEHLSTCPSCRKEEAVYRSLVQARSELTGFRVSDSFNDKLLNRIAQERFAETRTKAYLPKSAPQFAWGKIAPLTITVTVLLLVAFVAYPPGLNNSAGEFAENAGQGLDDSYLTVQPLNNPNMTIALNKNWSLTNQLAKVERAKKISNSVTRTNTFEPFGYGNGLSQASSSALDRVPYVPDYFSVRPIVRVYVLPDATSGKEVIEAY